MERRPHSAVETAMRSATYALFRKAILAEQQVTCTYDRRHRELCPHIIGTNKDGEEVVLAWQFAGESSGKLPQWRCLKLRNVRDARARDGEWFAGGSHQTTQRCVTDIDLDINVHVRKLR
jgi:predicted DNA-binding transcriptional regulator YafY